MIAAIIDTVFRVIDKVIPDPGARDAMKLELLRMEQAKGLKQLETDLATMQAQAGINLADAQSGNLLQYGWRPSVGWVCSAGLAYEFVGRPLLAWVGGFAGAAPPPSLELGELVTLLLALLGLGGYRTVEKLRGAA
jgi:hypothetical protein